MRTLAKPKTQAKSKPPAPAKGKDNPKQSKKVAKTEFISPFRYHMYKQSHPVAPSLPRSRQERQSSSSSLQLPSGNKAACRR